MARAGMRCKERQHHRNHHDDRYNDYNNHDNDNNNDNNNDHQHDARRCHMRPWRVCERVFVGSTNVQRLSVWHFQSGSIARKDGMFAVG